MAEGENKVPQALRVHWPICRLNVEYSIGPRIRIINSLNKNKNKNKNNNKKEKEPAV